MGEIVNCSVIPLANNKMVENQPQSTILIVEENKNYRCLLESVLKAMGSRVLVAENGSQALEIARTDTPDLILIETVMSKMSGLYLCKELKTYHLTEAIPIIILSSNNHIDDIMRGFELGAVDYITKPYSSSELVARIEAHLKIKFRRDAIIKQREDLKEMVQILCHDISRPLSAVISCFEISEYDPDFLDDNKFRIMSYIKQALTVVDCVRSLRDNG